MKVLIIGMLIIIWLSVLLFVNNYLIDAHIYPNLVIFLTNFESFLIGVTGMSTAFCWFDN